MQSNLLETWPEIKARHKREKIQLVQSLSKNYTYSQAAKILDWEAKALVRFCHEHGINFDLSQKGGYYE